MDNVFEILIYLIIIISFLSSIFKKKQTQQKRPPAQQPDHDESYQTEVSTTQSQPKEYDILRELEDFFKTGAEPSKTGAPITQRKEESVPSSGGHKTYDEWHEPTISEHIVDKWEDKKTEVKKILSSIDSAIEKKAAVFEESLWKKENVYSEIALSIRSKFKNPSTLKEYVIFSEILGKPKAFRR
jgi:hypothetical protein